MPLALWNQQWLNMNANRAYPLADWATKTDVTATVTIPDDFIVGLYLPVHVSLSVTPDRFFLKSLAVYSSGYNIAIGYDDETVDPPIVASVNIPRSTHTENKSYALVGSGDFDDCVGKIVIGSLRGIDDVPPGQYSFNTAGGALDADCIRPAIRGITALTVVSGSDRSERLYGDITFTAGANVQLTVNTFEDRDPEIVFSAISGEGLNEECACDDSDDTPAIRTINGIPPTSNADFRLIGTDCVTISPIANGLELHDTCSQPCCGCAELQPLYQQITRFSDGYVTLQMLTARLGAEVTQMSSVVLGSRLGDGGCLDC